MVEKGCLRGERRGERVGSERREECRGIVKEEKERRRRRVGRSMRVVDL